MPLPSLITFDIFGTIIDWHQGLSEALTALGRPLQNGEFERVVDRQGELEREQPFRPYREIARLSLVEVLGVPNANAEAIGRNLGRWPFFLDAVPALCRLLPAAPCAAITNSDRSHGEQVQTALGFPLSGWICAEDVGAYKPDPRLWEEASRRMGVPFGRHWWHVSAYADYDLEVAAQLGLTTVSVRRPYFRPGKAVHCVADLDELADILTPP